MYTSHLISGGGGGQILPLFLSHIPLTPLHPSSLTPHHSPLITYPTSLYPYHSPLFTYHSPLITHHASHTPHHLSITLHHPPLVSHPSSLTPRHSPLVTHPSSPTPKHSPLITHPSSFNPHPSLKSYNLTEFVILFYVQYGTDMVDYFLILYNCSCFQQASYFFFVY